MRSFRTSWLIGLIALYAAAFLIYAGQWAYTWDESYHLLAAQLIDRGKRLYIDFCFPQTPLNAYWNAGWMRLLGENWRVPHLFAALFTIGAVALIARYVFVRFPIEAWRAPAALSAALLTGLNAQVFVFAPLAQAYGICLFMLVAAFLAAVRAVEKKGAFWPLAAGIFAGIAAASSLLTAAAAPVLLIWMLYWNHAGVRWTKFAAFCAGTVIPFTPLIWLFCLAPRQTWFNVIQYHAFFRRLYWPDTTRHDLEVLGSWIDSGQALIIGLLALSGLAYIARRSQWAAGMKAELYLCAGLAAALSAEVARAHPTFERYFLLAVPFLSVLAAVGLYAIASRVFEPDRPVWAVGLLALLLVFGLSKSLYERRDLHWDHYEQLARKVDEVTPPGAPIYANEPIYFLTRRLPPPGLELYYTHKLDLGQKENELMHIIPAAALKREVQSGKFATAYSCDDDEISDFGLAKMYKQRADMYDCSIFWDRKN